MVLESFGVKLASMVAPLVGGVGVIMAWQIPVGGSPYTEIWRIALTLIVGIFVTLCGVIWRDMNRRMALMEQVSKESHRELIEKLEKLGARHERMLGVIITMALGMPEGKGEKLIQVLNSALEK